MSSIRITVLVDNNSAEGLSKEHGLSLWIEAEGKKIVFDTGQGDAFADNTKKLNINLSDTDFLVISHGHYDHTGGIPLALEKSSKAIVCCHTNVTAKRFNVLNKNARSLQMPQISIDAISNLPPERIKFSTAPLFLGDNIGITGTIPRKTDFEDTGGPFFKDRDGETADLIEDDLAMWLKTPEGLIVCTGCCHSGLINTLDYIRALSGENRLRAVIGGFHLLNADDNRISKTLGALKRMNPLLLAPCHCTGDNIISELKKHFGSKVVKQTFAGLALVF